MPSSLMEISQQTWAQQLCPTTNGKLENFEVTILNKASYFPILSTVSGAIRTVYGIGELAIGIILQIGGFFKSLFSDNDVALLGGILTCHGGINILRGLIEMIPLISSALFYAFDHDYRYNYNETIVKIPQEHQVNFNTFALATEGQPLPWDRVVTIAEQIQTGIDQGLYYGASTI